MKKLILLIAVTLMSCSVEELETSKTSNDCNCVMTVSEVETYTYWENGNPKLGVTYEVISTENVNCQVEVKDVELKDNIYYSITCN